VNKISPFLWFNDNAEAAASFYCSVFPNSKTLSTLRATEAGPGPVGSVIVIDLELNGQQVTFLNGGPLHQLSEAFSFVVRCESQAELDGYWAALTEGGEAIACGWLKDRFGMCWQVVPANLGQLVRHPKAMSAMMAMKKIDIAALERAALS
jgi:predicted 3-demethylubiquinone-9 3-methyltransferase (glyoxalase superfamily)